LIDRIVQAPRPAAGFSRFLPSLPRDALFTRRGALAAGVGALAALALAPLLFAAGPAQAANGAAPPIEPTQENQADIARIEDYLNGITTLRAKFQQYSEGGGVVFGDLYVRRPGRMRVEYAPPVPVVLIADGILVSYYDSELDQLSQLPISSTPAWFLLRDDISLSDGVTVTALDKKPGALRLTMYQTKEPEAGSVELIFADQPLELRQWKITDAAGKQARIGLFDVRIGGALPNELFATPRTRRRTSGNE
jgi:outer membrane lipoprotein-sorting protein